MAGVLLSEIEWNEATSGAFAYARVPLPDNGYLSVYRWRHHGNSQDRAKPFDIDHYVPDTNGGDDKGQSYNGLDACEAAALIWTLTSEGNDAP